MWFENRGEKVKEIKFEIEIDLQLFGFVEFDFEISCFRSNPFGYHQRKSKPNNNGSFGKISTVTTFRI